jgi:hypothetical protein
MRSSIVRMLRIGRHGANGHLATHRGAAQLEWHLWIHSCRSTPLESKCARDSRAQSRPLPTPAGTGTGQGGSGCYQQRGGCVQTSGTRRSREAPGPGCQCSGCSASGLGRGCCGGSAPSMRASANGGLCAPGPWPSGPGDPRLASESVPLAVTTARLPVAAPAGPGGVVQSPRQTGPLQVAAPQAARRPRIPVQV